MGNTNLDPGSRSARIQELFDKLFGGRRPVVVSHRGPVTYHLDEDGLHPKPSAGGLAGALRCLDGHAPLTWVACAASEGDHLVATRPTAPAPLQGGSLRLRLVALPRQVYHWHYEVFSNPILWFVQHGLADQLFPEHRRVMDEAWAQGYVPANVWFASHVARELRQQDTAPTVFVHDYHLYLLPGLLRQQFPGITIHHFLHIPWPEPASWCFLSTPVRQAIVESLAAADVVGFQTHRSAHNFLQTCRALLPDAVVDEEGGLVEWRGRQVCVRAYPISVDPRHLRSLRATPEFRCHQARFRDMAKGRVIVRVDRLDPSKNVLRGFEAFARLLERRPAWREAVTFLSFLVPSRSTIPEYRQLAERTLAAVKEINQRFGTETWQPIHLFYQHDQVQALAGLSIADVVLVNPVADGMNLVAKEAIVVNERDGVLVLSKRAGAYEELWPGCLGINPFDVDATANALAEALDMPEGERRQRLRLLKQIVEESDLQTWFANQLEDLARFRDEGCQPTLSASPEVVYH
ncbi:MAG TPA: trehalose-6-phosphate synthase [Chloroflexota bacterium]